jgi:ABC-type branched-subunit amino acid transport system substrate-binding protein
MWYVNAADATGVFNERYATTYGKNPVAGTANAYDIVKFIIEASEKESGNTKPTTNDIRENLANTKISGALGNLSIDKEGFVLSKAVVRIIKEGKPVTISN